jgi:hypothetical protein
MKRGAESGGFTRGGERVAGELEGMLREAEQRWRPYMADEETRHKVEELLTSKVMLAEFRLATERPQPAGGRRKRSKVR